jgi:hypothetical protein
VWWHPPLTTACLGQEDKPRRASDLGLARAFLGVCALAVHVSKVEMRVAPRAAVQALDDPDALNWRRWRNGLAALRAGHFGRNHAANLGARSLELMHTDPWPEVERLAAERRLDLSPLYEVRDRAVSDGRFIDADNALGNTALLVLQTDGSVADAVARATAQIDAALNQGD